MNNSTGTVFDWTHLDTPSCSLPMNRTRNSLEMHGAIEDGSWPQLTSQFWRCSLSMNPDTAAVLTSVKNRGFHCPEGTIENSPAFQRWVECQTVASPIGTTEVRSYTSSFNRPFGTCDQAGPFPALKRRAILTMSLRDTKFAEFPKGIRT